MTGIGSKSTRVRWQNIQQEQVAQMERQLQNEKVGKNHMVAVEWCKPHSHHPQTLFGSFPTYPTNPVSTGTLTRKCFSNVSTVPIPCQTNNEWTGNVAPWGHHDPPPTPNSSNKQKLSTPTIGKFLGLDNSFKN